MPGLNKVIFGTAQLCRVQGLEKQIAVLETAYDCGITHFDIARLYGFGDVEKVFGLFLKGKSGKISVSNKFGYVVPRIGFLKKNLFYFGRKVVNLFPRIRTNVPSLKKLGFEKDYSVKHCISSLRESFRLTGLDYFDCYFLHDCEFKLHYNGELLNFLEKLKVEGRIRNIGVTGSYADCLDFVNSSKLIQCVQYQNNSCLQFKKIPTVLNFSFGAFPKNFKMEKTSSADKSYAYAQSALFNLNNLGSDKVLINSTQCDRIKKFVKYFVDM